MASVPMPLRAIDSPLAKELAETMLLRHDMRSALSAMKLYCDRYFLENRSDEEAVLGRSLFRDAVVQFIGCFDQTAEVSLSMEQIYQQQHIAYFQWLKDMRDAYVAHRFGAYRQCVVGVVVNPSHEIVGSGHLMQTFAGLRKSESLQLLKFMQIASGHLDDKVKVLEDQLLAGAKAMTRDELRALRNATTYGIDPSEVRMSRPALKKARSSSGQGR